MPLYHQLQADQHRRSEQKQWTTLQAGHKLRKDQPLNLTLKINIRRAGTR